MKSKLITVALLGVLLISSCIGNIPVTGKAIEKATLTRTAIVVTTTAALPTNTVIPLTFTAQPSPSVPGDILTPYPSAPLCSDTGASHVNTEFHTLWDEIRGCHYDHEHGTSPFTPEVAAVFPGFDLYALLGNVEVGHTNPSSSMENTHKHGGMKWDVMLAPTHGCLAGFENAAFCVTAAVIQYHNFGPYDVEMEARVHSTAALLKTCNPASPSTCGYIYTVQHQEYGQRVSPYQGAVVPYPNNPTPAYGAGFGPYFTTDCVYTGLTGCRTDLAFIRNRNLNTNSIWTSKPTGAGVKPVGSTLFKLLFRVRDTYQVLDSRDLTHPFTFAWVCSNDNGVTYNPANCRWNNSTSKVHEVAGTIPAAWDGLEGFDTDPRAGRVSGLAFTNRFGALDLNCTQANDNCFPVKLSGMFVGVYGDYLTAAKVSGTSPTSNPERDIYFCSGVPCSETSTGAVPSGWIEAGN